MNQHLELKAQPGIIQPRRRRSDQPYIGWKFKLFAYIAVFPPAWVALLWGGLRIAHWFGRHWK